MAVVRASHTRPAVPSAEQLRAELHPRGNVIERLADRVVSRAAKARGTATTRTQAFAPVTLRLARKDAALAMLCGALAGGRDAFDSALAAVINGRLTALGSNEVATVRASLSGRKASVTVSIDPPPPAPPASAPVAAPTAPVLVRVGSVPGSEIIPLFATLTHFRACYPEHGNTFDRALAALLASHPPGHFDAVVGVHRASIDGFVSRGESVPRGDAYRAINYALELARDGKLGQGGQLKAEDAAAALAAFARTTVRDPAAPTTFEQLLADHAPHREAIESSVDTVLAYWSPDAVAKDFGITRNELVAFQRAGAALPYGATRGVLRRLLDAVHVRDCMSNDAPAVDPAKLLAAIAALGEPPTEGR